jgi:hypothetical protein
MEPITGVDKIPIVTEPADVQISQDKQGNIQVGVSNQWSWWPSWVTFPSWTW